MKTDEEMYQFIKDLVHKEFLRIKWRKRIPLFIIAVYIVITILFMLR